MDDETRSILMLLCRIVDAIRREVPGSEGAPLLWSGEPAPPVPPGCVGLDRLRGVIRNNAFNTQEQVFARGECQSCSAIFVFASRFNHACCSNAERHFVGRTMFIRALREIRAGDEITINYATNLLPLEDRVERHDQWGFTCDCEWCAEQRADPDYPKRASLLARLGTLPGPAAVRLFFKELPWLRQSTKGLKFKTQLAQIIIMMSNGGALLENGDFGAVLDLTVEVTTLIGDMPTDEAAAAWVSLARLYVMVNQAIKGRAGARPEFDVLPPLRRAVAIAKVIYGCPRELLQLALRLDGDDPVLALLEQVAD
jgi:hypothetical protein